MTQEEIERLKAEQPDHKHAFEMKEGGYIKTLEDKYRKAARAKYHDCGVIEVDPDAKLSAAVSVIGDEGAGGCYVQVWAWVDAADLEEVE